MRPKPVTPYERLLRESMQFLSQVVNPKRTNMWRYPKEKLGTAWTLSDLYERVAAADQLGFDVLLIAGDDGLSVKYQQRPKRPTRGPLSA